MPAVGNTHEIQNGRSPARDWFMKMAASVNERVTKGITSQGFYVAAPDGKGYGFNNNRSVERVNWFMDNALKKLKDNPPQVVEISQSEVDAPFNRPPDPKTAVMRVFARIRPVPEGCAASNKSVARDHFWIYPEEIKEILASSQAGARDAPFTLPRSVVARLVRFHLIDNVRGEPDFWRADEVRDAQITCRTVRMNGPSSTIRFTGAYEMRTASGARGLVGKIEGQIYVAKDGVFSLKAYGEAQAWGAGTYTPDPPAGKFPMVFAIVGANDAASKIVPPQGIMTGEYERARF